MLLMVFCFVRPSEQTEIFPYITFTDWFCVPQVQSIYCMVRTESLHKTDTFILKGLIHR